jgi:hypothetical protein
MSETHPLLRAAQKIAKVACPTTPSHLGGQPPVLSAKLRGHVAIWCAERVGVSAEPGERTAIAKELEEAHAFLEDRVLCRAHQARVADPKRHQKSRLSVGRLAVDSALYAHCKPGSINRVVREAIEMSIRIERDVALKTDAGSTMRRFVEDLDQELMCREVQGMLAQHVGSIRRVTRVLWRRAVPSQLDRVNHVIVAVAEDRFGLLFERRARSYEWHEGDRDEVLATVPDELMADAIRVVFDHVQT